MLRKVPTAVLISILFVNAFSNKSNYDWNKCEQIFQVAGINASAFPFLVTHAIHSLTVEDLSRFEPSITENNKVPTVNRDLSSEDRVLPYAPKR